MYLLDTVALSALMKPGGAPAVEAWFEGVDLDELHMPAPVLGELRRGIARLPNGPRKERLEDAYAMWWPHSSRTAPPTTPRRRRCGAG